MGDAGMMRSAHAVAAAITRIDVANACAERVEIGARFSRNRAAQSRHTSPFVALVPNADLMRRRNFTPSSELEFVQWWVRRDSHPRRLG